MFLVSFKKENQGLGDKVFRESFQWRIGWIGDFYYNLRELFFDVFLY